MSPEAQRIASYLEERVRKRGINGVVYYNQLADNLGYPRVTDAWLSHPFAAFFDEIDVEDADNKKPFRTALVINEKENHPGFGFWGMVIRLRLPTKSKFSDKEKLTFYSEELEALERCYPASPPRAR